MIDTANKRASAIGFALPFLLIAPMPDGSLAQAGDRQHLAHAYRLAEVTASAGTPSGTGGLRLGIGIGLTMIRPSGSAGGALAVSQLSVARQPVPAGTAVAFSTQPVVTVRDSANALVTSATNAVTATLVGSGGVLSGTTTVNAVNGAATFTDLMITGPGTYTLAFTATGLTGVSSGSIVVLATTGDLAYSNFNNGLLTPFTDPWGFGTTVIDDPTGSGRGKVVKVNYSTGAGNSIEHGLSYVGSTMRYGGTIWLKADLYLPSAFTNRVAADNRKLIDYQGDGVRMTLHRVGANDLRLSCVDWMNGSEQEVIAVSTGLTIPDDTWTTIEVRMTTNSADNVRDGIVEVYLNGAVTPSYRRATGLGWITQAFAGGSYFNTYLTGFQLTISGGTAYAEDRYWDNLNYSTARLA